MIEQYEQEMNEIRSHFRNSEFEVFGESIFMNNIRDILEGMLEDAYNKGYNERDRELKEHWLNVSDMERVL